jgi:hypothetical protein|tara:strand:+ start:315 stop:806 length:492 start_codon:yes stop_codon:yes gene_type:complete
MNIFYLHSDPRVAASYFYDKHKVKMILECAQMLCTAHIALGNEDVPYKKSHLNHPSSVWVRANNENYQWLYNHMLALGEEYTKRYKRTHLTITKCKDILAVAPLNIPTGSFNEPPQCMPDEYKVDNDSVSAYWNYYEQDKYKIANKNEQKIIRPLNINELCEH